MTAETPPPIGNQYPQGQRGQDVTFPTTITNEQASLGFKKDVDLSFQLLCLKCRGSGGDWNDSRDIWYPCPNCQFGIVTGSTSLQIEIPPGTQDGDQIRLPGKGGPGGSGCPAGDCICIIRVVRPGLLRRLLGLLRRHSRPEKVHLPVKDPVQLESPPDLSDLLGELFGGFCLGASAQKFDGTDMLLHLTISAAEAAAGVEKQLTVYPFACETGNDKGRVTDCSCCGGTGWMAENAGLSRIQTTCSKCKGSGGPSCKTCDGRQHDPRSRSLSVRIPSNARDRMRVRIRGQGKAVMGGESGDLYIKVRVQPEGQPSGAGAALGV